MNTYHQNLLVNAASIGKRLLSEGNSFIISLTTLCAPSCIIAYMRSSSFDSRIMLNKRRAVDSLLLIPMRPPYLSSATSFLIRKWRLAYIIVSVNTAGARSFCDKVQLRIEIASKRIGKVFLKARNSRSILLNWMLNSLKSPMYSEKSLSKKFDLMN